MTRDGVSLGPVWAMGTNLLAWDGPSVVAHGDGAVPGSAKHMEEARAIMEGIQNRGWEFLTAVRGPFRLVWIDLSSGRWIMARSPHGPRPLFWWSSPGGVCFSTDIPSLLDLMPSAAEPNWNRFPEYMVFQSLAGGETLYGGVRELLPGQVVIGSLQSREPESRSLWSQWLESQERHGAHPGREAGEVLREAIERSLSRDTGNTRGLFLSGGVDSALLAWGLRDADPPQEVPCLTVTCQGYRHDEGPFAQKVAQELGLQWRPIGLTPSLFSRAWAEALNAMGLPMTSTNQVIWWILCRAAAELGWAAAFSGEGADGWFCGGLYQEEREALVLAREDRGETARIVINCRTHTLNDPSLVERVLHPPLDLRPRLRLWEECVESPGHLMERAVLYHVRTAGHRLLSRAELVAQSHGLALELPFLETDFLAWSRALGWDGRNPGGVNKGLLKALCSRRFGPELAYRKKIGFPFPLRTWIRDSQEALLRTYRDMLLDTRTMGRPIYCQPHLDRELRSRLDGSLRPADWFLWSLINLELWLRWVEERRRPQHSPGALPCGLGASPGAPAGAW